MENLEGNNKNVSLSLLNEYGASDSESDSETPSIGNMTNEESEESLEMSEMVIKNNIINACAHGPLSRDDPSDDGDVTTRHMIIDSAESGVVEYEVTEYRNVVISDSSSSDSSDSDIDSVKDVDELSSSDDIEENAGDKKDGPPKVAGELGLDDLPPIEDLAISLPSQDTTKIGTVASIVDRLVVVAALPNTPAVDIDSILFLDNGAKALGQVFDVFGPVSEPHYCVRFNSCDHIKERGVQPGMDVFIAPKSQHTSYVFISELMKIKGSDASWLNDVEPPPNQIEYSDDEDERRARKQKKKPEGDTGPPENERPQIRRNQRPVDTSSRFGGPSRGRNPFAYAPRRMAPPHFRPSFRNSPPNFRNNPQMFRPMYPPPHWFQQPPPGM